MKTWVYSWLVYPFLYSIAMLLGVGNRKIRDTLRLRAWKDFLGLRFNVGEPIDYWVHVASHGELEYAIPLLTELGRRERRVLITYYSISAKIPVEQLRERFENVSLVVPLPHDGLGLMREFVALARKQGVRCLLLLKYELWPGVLWECNSRGIKVILVDALKPSWFHRRLLHKLDGIFSGYESEILSLPHKNVRVLGDTRVERVLERISRSESQMESILPKETLTALAATSTLVCGSMWPPDTRVVIEAIRLLKDKGIVVNLIWVPHELDQVERIRAETALSKLGYQVQSADQSGALPGKSIAVIVMKKGILAELYHLGKLAYVGGGFGSGVHSVWEPALTGAYVACGPRTERSPESRELQKHGRLLEVIGPSQLAEWLGERISLLRDKRVTTPNSLEELLSKHLGASSRIIEACERM
ncbi:MAG: glycosyltransferase N-terminal domain-containing protein [Bdellovibrionota bacterium]